MDDAQQAANLAGRCLTFHFEQHLADEHVLDTSDGWSLRTEDTFAEGVAQLLDILCNHGIKTILITPFHIDDDEASEGRISIPAAVFELRFSHCEIVVTDHLLEKQVLWVATLDDDLALLSLASSSTSCNLFHELESAFVCTEIWEVHQSVGAKDAYCLY